MNYNDIFAAEPNSSFLSSSPDHSLFSCIITLYALLFLYSPYCFFPFLFSFSPVLLTTFLLLLHLLRFGAAQAHQAHQAQPQASLLDDTIDDQSQSKEFDNVILGVGVLPNADPRLHAESYVEWDVRAPLQVIYEGEEGDDDENDDDGILDVRLKREAELDVIRRYASLSLCYPDSDGDYSSSSSSSSFEGSFSADGDWHSPGNVWSLWKEDDYHDEDDDKEGLIEIALDEDRNEDDDEENLIEIDLSLAVA